MTPSDISRIRSSFASLAEDPEGLAGEFYGRLFASAPAVRPLFRSDIEEQGRKLVAMLTIVVRSLDRLDTVLEAVRSLGRRHAGYGATPAHYAPVGAALLATIDARLGPACTDEIRASWSQAYGVISAVMIEASTNP